jgi:hypothetical protein
MAYPPKSTPEVSLVRNRLRARSGIRIIAHPLLEGQSSQLGGLPQTQGRRRSPEKRINLLQADKSPTPIVGDMGVNYA